MPNKYNIYIICKNEEILWRDHVCSMINIKVNTSYSMDLPNTNLDSM